MGTLVPNGLWAEIEPLLPRKALKPNGGRPPSVDFAALAGIMLVLRTGMPWKHVPRSVLGCSGKTSWRRLGTWQAAGVRAALHRVLERLHDADALNWSRAALDRAACRRQGGEATDPHLTDRDKSGTNRHIVVDARGTPLGVTLSGANRRSSRMLTGTLDAVLSLCTGRRGRPRRSPSKLHADKAYDHRRSRRAC